MRVGSEIELERSGGRAAGTAYRVAPPSGRGRAVLVTGDAEALSDFERAACERLARAGYLALVPDLERVPDAHATLATAVLCLLDDDASDGARVGVVGFGRGGTRALHLAAEHERVGAAVDFYGMPSEKELEALEALEKPALLAFGAEDARVVDGRAAALGARLPGARLHVEPGAGDGYMDDRWPDRYAASAAAAGWEAAIAFLGATL